MQDDFEFKHCIFCGRSTDQIRLSKEHMFPSAIGGMLTFDNMVCEKCNNDLGAFIDSCAFQSNEILEAAAAFGFIEDKSKYLNRTHNIFLETEGHKIKARMVGDDIKPLPHKVSEDHMIISDEETEKTFRKLVNRDERLKEVGLSNKFIEQETEKLLRRYKEAQEGEKVESKTLGRILVKGTSTSKVSIIPRNSEDNVKLLVAKIAYEFLALVGYGNFFQSERINNLLFDSLNKYEIQPGLVIERVQAPIKGYHPFHALIVEFTEDFTFVIISFFGSISYEIIAPPMKSDFLNFHGREYDIDNLIGFQFEENWEKKTKSFWGIDKDGNRKGIASV